LDRAGGLRPSAENSILSSPIATRCAARPRLPHSGSLKGGPDIMQVFVRDNDMNGALRVLKKKMQREGTFREMKRRRTYEKPSERRIREKAEGVRRRRKALRKRMEREGY
jgi:small subunit ribosomal protein S21